MNPGHPTDPAAPGGGHPDHAAPGRRQDPAAPNGHPDHAGPGCGPGRAVEHRRWPRLVLIAGGTAVMAYAVVGALADRDVHPVGHLLFLAGVLLAHDLVLLPAALGVGVLIGRYVPAGARPAVRLAGFATVTLLVVALPLVLGLGRRPDTPSALPLRYDRGLAVTVLLVWTVWGVAALARRYASRRAARPGPVRGRGVP